jgi:hypothetical protein
MTAFLFSCDHATCAVPEAHRELFRGQEDVLTSTEGWEPGSLNLAQGFSMKFRTPLVHGDVTRLLIDLSANGDGRWSRFTEKAPEALRGKLIDRHERPYRLALRQRISEELRRNDVLLHVMVHTDPLATGDIRLHTLPGADLAEKFARAWRTPLAAAGLDVRHVPATMLSDLAEELGKEYPADRYAIVQLKVAQSFFMKGLPWKWETVKKLLLTSLGDAAETVVTARSGPSFG